MLREYQIPHYQHILRVLVKNKSALDASDTGTGKTFVALAIAKALEATPLVLGTRSGAAGWHSASKALGVDVEFVNYEKIKPRLKKGDLERRRESEWALEVPHGKGSYIRWKQPYELGIFDEGHRCGGNTSLNSKMLIAARRQFKYVLVLSATAADDPRQMKALGFTLGLHLLGKKIPGMTNWLGFLFRHGVTPGHFGGFELSKDEAKLTKAFQKLHHEVFPSKGGRMVKALIPNFPRTQIEAKLLTDFTDKAKGTAEELHNTDPRDFKEAIRLRQKLETLKVPHFCDIAEDYAQTSKVALFFNFTDPLFECYEELKREFGNDRVGYISGLQTGPQGDAERRRFLQLMQENKLDALCCNTAAAGESASMHDPTGQVERTSVISPGESGRMLKQVLGRVHRDGGAFSQQFVTFFENTYEQPVAERLMQKNFNLDLFNDGEALKI